MVRGEVVHGTWYVVSGKRLPLTTSPPEGGGNFLTTYHVPPPQGSGNFLTTYHVPPPQERASTAVKVFYLRHDALNKA